MHTKLALIAVAASTLSIAAPATAQRGPANYAPLPPSTAITQCCYSQAAGAFPVVSVRDQAPDPDSICLTRKSTGGQVCHTRKEWELIASKMEGRKTSG